MLTKYYMPRRQKPNMPFAVREGHATGRKQAEAIPPGSALPEQASRHTDP
jgi:hypothetical protein